MVPETLTACTETLEEDTWEMRAMDALTIQTALWLHLSMPTPFEGLKETSLRSASDSPLAPNSLAIDSSMAE